MSKEYQKDKKNKTETEKLKKENKIEGHKIRIESIKDTKKEKQKT